MARTNITVQRLDVKSGEEITFQPIDATNGMQYKNTGAQVVLIKTGASDTVSVTVPSVADPFNRLGDIGPIAVGINKVMSFGPFTPPDIWGDGAALAFLNFPSSSGAPQIAVVNI